MLAGRPLGFPPAQVWGRFVATSPLKGAGSLMLDERAVRAEAEDDGYVQFLEAGEAVKGEYHCVGCG